MPMLNSGVRRLVIGATVALAIIALLAWARNDPGVGGRQPDPPQSTEVVGDEGSVPPQDTTVVTTGDTVSATT
jgi:hypothetical protein